MVFAFVVMAAAPSRAQTALSPIELAGRDIALRLADVAQCTADRSTRVGVWPYDTRDIPIEAASARSIYEEFLRGFLKGAPDCFDTIDVSGIGVTLKLLHSSGTDWAAGARTLEELEKHRNNVEYLVAGSIIEEGSTPFAIFKATARPAGKLIAQVGPVAIPQDLAGGTCGSGAIPLGRALDQIASKLSQAAPEMTHLVVEGGYFENTNARTAFSAHLEDLLVTGLAEAHKVLTKGAALTVRRIHTTDSTVLRSFRGVTVSPRQMDDALVAPEVEDGGADAGVYRLSFRYWICEETARLQVTLQGSDGVPHSWIGNVRLGTLPPGIKLEPSQPVDPADWGGGELDFQVTSPRGPNPTYKVGEFLTAMFRLENDGWVYCFYTSSDGKTVQVLPNEYQAKTPNAHFYEAGKLHQFPDDKRLPNPDEFTLEVTGKSYGIEPLRCFATSRDVRADLPVDLQGRSFAPIPPKYAARLKEVFQSVDGAVVATGSLTVTVVE